MKCRHFHVSRSICRPPKTLFFVQKIVCCRYVCMQNQMNHMYTTYTSYGICIYIYVWWWHMSILISPIHIWIRMHNTDSISPFNTRWGQPRDLVLRFYRRNPKSQEWFRRRDTICLSASFFFFFFGCNSSPKRWFNPSYVFIRHFLGVLTSLITGRGPPCRILF